MGWETTLSDFIDLLSTNMQFQFQHVSTKGVFSSGPLMRKKGHQTSISKSQLVAEVTTLLKQCPRLRTMGLIKDIIYRAQGVAKVFRFPMLSMFFFSGTRGFVYYKLLSKDISKIVKAIANHFSFG